MKKIIWILLDDRAGSVSQARGVEQYLDKEKFEVVEKQLKYNRLAGLPNFIRGRSLLGISAESKALLRGQMPDVVLSTSRRTVPVARHLKKESKGKCKLVQLMHPGNTGMQDFELIFVPEHDYGKKSGENVRYIVGCAHKITPQSLEEAHKKWKSEFASLQHPLIAVIVGGAIKGREFSSSNAKRLGKLLAKFQKATGGTLLITTSRRTGKKAQDALVSELKGLPSYMYLWGDKRENPYMGFLSEADQIVVTGDSVSMCCEAVGAGKPVYIFEGEDWLTAKHTRFVNSLYKNDYAYRFEGQLIYGKRSYEMYNPAYKIAEKIGLIV